MAIKILLPVMLAKKMCPDIAKSALRRVPDHPWLRPTMMGDEHTNAQHSTKWVRWKIWEQVQVYINTYVEVGFRVSLDWLWTFYKAEDDLNSHLLVSASQGQGLQTCTIVPNLCCSGNRTWDFMHAREALYQLSCMPVHINKKNRS